MSAEPATPDMSGKTCLITGATSGIGAATADALALAGATVLLVGRDPGRCEAAAAKLRAAHGGTAIPLPADLSSLDELRRLADEVKRVAPRLDVLVNNAGAMYESRRESADGIEMTWALNHLSYFVLTNLLADHLKASAPARVVSVASDAHRAMRRGLDWDDLEATRRYRLFRAYAQSKLANILFNAELARRLEGTGVTANCLHPGFVRSSIFVGNGRIGWVFGVFAKVLAVEPEVGARTSVHLASSPEVAGVTGQYFEKSRPRTPAAPARDADAARRLWYVSAERTGLTQTA